MLRFLGAAVAAIVTLWTAPVGATVISYQDVVQPSERVRVTTTSPFAFQLSITGFEPGDLAATGLFSIVLSDDGKAEDIGVSIDGHYFLIKNTGNAAQTYSFNLGQLGLLDVLSDGVIDVVISAEKGSFFVDKGYISGLWQVGHVDDDDESDYDDGHGGDGQGNDDGGYYPDPGEYPPLPGGYDPPGGSTEVSEPGVLALFGFGLLAIGVYRYRRSRNAA